MNKLLNMFNLVNIFKKRTEFNFVEFVSVNSRSSIRLGFTLAEVLITLGIIGVVAAMTLPTLIQSNQDKVTVNKLKKVYSYLSQAYMMIYKDNGDPTNWGMSLAEKDDDGNILGAEGSKNMGDLFSKYLNVTKNCGLDEGCWYNGETYKLNGTPYEQAGGGIEKRSDLYKIRLSDGTLMAFGGLSGDCSLKRGNTKQLSNICSWVIVDINGENRPNTYGIDLFEFNVTKYGILPYGTPDDTMFGFETNCKKSAATSGNGCTAWVLYKENLDYTKCNDLSWNGKHKCK